MSHYYYRGNRHPIKMSYLLVVLQVNKHIPEIHQEKKGVTEAVLYFDISSSKALLNSKYAFHRNV